MTSGPDLQASGSFGLSPGECLAAFALGALVIVSSLVWIAGEVAALLASGEPLRSGVTAAQGTLLRLTRHGSDPALAWPAADRAVLPGPVVFYAIGLVLLVLLFSALFVALRVYARISGGAGRERDARALPVLAIYAPSGSAGRSRAG